MATESKSGSVALTGTNMAIVSLSTCKVLKLGFNAVFILAAYRQHTKHTHAHVG